MSKQYGTVSRNDRGLASVGVSIEDRSDSYSHVVVVTREGQDFTKLEFTLDQTHDLIDLLVNAAYDLDLPEPDRAVLAGQKILSWATQDDISTVVAVGKEIVILRAELGSEHTYSLESVTRLRNLADKKGHNR